MGLMQNIDKGGYRIQFNKRHWRLPWGLAVVFLLSVFFVANLIVTLVFAWKMSIFSLPWILFSITYFFRVPRKYGDRLFLDEDLQRYNQSIGYYPEYDYAAQQAGYNDYIHWYYSQHGYNDQEIQETETPAALEDTHAYVEEVEGGKDNVAAIAKRIVDAPQNGAKKLSKMHWFDSADTSGIPQPRSSNEDSSRNLGFNTEAHRHGERNVWYEDETGGDEAASKQKDKQ